MKQGLLSWSPSLHFFSLPSHLSLKPTNKTTHPICATLESVDDKTVLTARERRQLRNERRESKGMYNWREEVEERLMKKPKKKYKSWTEELNLDNLALLGPQWWVVRVSGQDTAQRMARALVRNFPEFEFKVYAPASHVKRKLKNGSILVKPKPLFPGCVFLYCVMNKEIHDFIRECDGVGGFIGSKVGNTKRQINKPRPVSSDDMEAIFRQAKEEQEKADQAFKEEHPGEGALHSEILDKNSPQASKDENNTSKPKRRSRKASEALKDGPSMKELHKLLPEGSTVRVLSGAFAEFSGTVKKLDSKRRMATIGFTLFGKETLADLDVNEIVAETS